MAVRPSALYPRTNLPPPVPALERRPFSASWAGQATTRQFEGLLTELHTAGVEAAVLACTELPLVRVEALCQAEGRAAPSVSLIDPTELLATALLARQQR